MGTHTYFAKDRAGRQLLPSWIVLYKEAITTLIALGSPDQPPRCVARL